MENSYNLKKTRFIVTLSIFLIYFFTVFICLIYFTIQLYKSKTIYVIKYNYSSFFASLSYMDMDGLIRNTLQSMLKSQIIASYQVYYDNSLISKSSTNFRCDNSQAFFSTYINNVKINDEFYFSYFRKKIYICYKKNFFNNNYKKVGTIQISVPVKYSDFNDFFILMIIFLIIIFFIYVFLVIYINKYFKIMSNSKILSHDITLPILMAENSLKFIINDSTIDIKERVLKNIVTLQTARSIVEYIINKYVYEKKSVPHKLFKSINEIIEKCFMSFEYMNDIKISFTIVNKNENLFVKIIEQDLYIIFMNLIKNGIESSQKRGFNYIHFSIEYYIFKSKLIIYFTNSNTNISKNSISLFKKTKEKYTGKNKGNGAYIILEALGRNNGKIEIVNNLKEKSVTFLIMFEKIQFSYQKNEILSNNNRLQFILIDDDHEIINEWRRILINCYIISYLNPESFFKDIISNKINCNNFHVIITDFIFNSENTSSIITSDRIKLGFKIKRKYKFNGLLILSSSLSEFDFSSNKELSYYDKNLENKFLSYKEIESIYKQKIGNNYDNFKNSQ